MSRSTGKSGRTTTVSWAALFWQALLVRHMSLLGPGTPSNGVGCEYGEGSKRERKKRKKERKKEGKKEKMWLF